MIDFLNKGRAITGKYFYYSTRKKRGDKMQEVVHKCFVAAEQCSFLELPRDNMIDFLDKDRTITGNYYYYSTR